MVILSWSCSHTVPLAYSSRGMWPMVRVWIGRVAGGIGCSRVVGRLVVVVMVVGEVMVVMGKMRARTAVAGIVIIG